MFIKKTNDIAWRDVRRPGHEVPSPETMFDRFDPQEVDASLDDPQAKQIMKRVLKAQQGQMGFALRGAKVRGQILFGC